MTNVYLNRHDPDDIFTAANDMVFPEVLAFAGSVIVVLGAVYLIRSFISRL